MSVGSKPRFGVRAGRLALALGIVTVLVGGAAWLRTGGGAARAEGPDGARPPLPVDVVTARLIDAYPVRERFAGLVEPARRTRLAFERGGLVTEILVEEGGAVTEGMVVARLDRAQLRASRDRLVAQRTRAEADRELADLTAERQTTLNERGHVSRQRADEARLAAAAAAASIGEVTAAINSVEIDLAKSELRAPFAGTVGARLIDEGAVVAAGTPVLDLLETGAPQARIGVTPAVAAALEAGTRGEITVGGRAVPARLLGVRPDVTPETRTVVALFALEPPAGGPPLRFGDAAELTLERLVAARVAALPTTALIEGDRGLWSVFVAEPAEGGGHRIAREAVDVLHVAGTTAFVTGSFAEGARIVADGPHRVIPGQDVTPIDTQPAELAATEDDR